MIITNAPVSGARRVGHRGLTFIAIVGLVVLGGCDPGASEQTTAWDPPTWMAEQAQQREQFVTALQSCMDARGWNLTVDDSAGFAEPLTSESEMQRATEDSHACLREQGIDADSFSGQPLESDLRAMYPYDVDTYECLVAQGIDMEDSPPTIEVYVEQGLSSSEDSDSWWPYFDPAIIVLSQQEIAELERTCPTRWVFAGAT